MELPQPMPARPHHAPCCLVALLAIGTASAAAAESATASVTVTAEFASRTSLKVSTQVLQFDVSTSGDPAFAVVDFSAAARTRTGGEVLLTVEPRRAVEGGGGAADIETAITFSDTGTGTVAGTLQNGSAAIAGRWNGSGLRIGRLTFALHAAVGGSYSVPVRFVLSTP